MKKFQLLAFAAGVLAGLVVTQHYVSAAARPNVVPCGVFAPGAKCVNPIVEGVVDGQWIALIFRYNGTNGGPDAVDVVSIGFGGNGFQTVLLSQIKPAGDYGDRMGAAFRKGKLFVSNAIYLPGEAHCCFTHTTFRRFGFHNGKLLVEREASVLTTASATQIDSALGQGTHYL